jgi:CheY-like chemotaxis protein
MSAADASRPGPKAPGETTLLVVDDALVDQRLAGGIAHQGLGWKVAYAANGRQALAVLERQPPDLVLTDLQMPEMDGLQLVEAVRARHPSVPVVLMTAFGNEEIALRALQQGAASYVPKKNLEWDLVPTLERVQAAALASRSHYRLLGCVTQLEVRLALENDPALVPALIAHLQEYLAPLRLTDETGAVRVGVALEEALINALYHGNLELSSELLREDGSYQRRAEERRRQPPYRDRRVHVTARLAPAEVVYVVRDEGPGFDPSTLPDPCDPANLERLSGRGLLLIRTFMDEVSYNEAGNEVTLVKRRPRLRANAPSPSCASR